MSPVVDETAGDLPVRDVGLMKRALMPAAPDPQRLFRFPRAQLEDLCLRLQEENSVLRQHTRAQEQRLRRMSTRLMRLRQTRPGSGAVKDRDMEDTVQELEARVAMLESQKEVLQDKLCLAKQHIVDLGARTPYKLSRGKHVEGESGVRRAAQTAPPRCGVTLEDTRAEMERFRSSLTDQVRMAELELTAQALKDTLREKEKEVEGTIRELRKQQADKHRTTIRENVDLIRLQKQLSEKSASLRVSQEKVNSLQEAYENQLEETQRSLKESQGALLEKVEELTEQLKQERQKSLTLDGQLTTTTLSLQALDKLQERISDLEGERDTIKKSYDTLLMSALSTHSSRNDQDEKLREVEQKEKLVENICSEDVQRLEGMLQAEREERSKLGLEKEKLRQEKETLEEQRKQEEDLSVWMKERQEHLEQEVVHYKQQVFTLQNRLDSISKEFDMSIEELSETLVQIKAFRMQQESREGLRFLLADGKVEDSTSELVNIQASYAETVLELQKTRNLLLLEHKITTDLQEELNTVNQKAERDKEENRRRTAEKDKLLAKRTLQINTLQAQLKELAYSPRSYKRTIPIQYTWPAGDHEVVQPIEDDLSFSQLKAGESLLEIHLKAATFTPTGLRIMSNIHPGVDRSETIVTFCTYCLLDFEMHSTPLVSGSQPTYGFTSRYALTARDLGRLGGQGSRVQVELHQALGGVRFVTHGSGHMLLMGAMERRGERIGGGVNIKGHEGEIFGVVDFWVRLFPPAEPIGAVAESAAERRTVTQRSQAQIMLGWQDSVHEGEMSFEQDFLVEGGCLSIKTNGTEYREVRQFQSDHHLVRFYFVTRVFSEYMQKIMDDIRHGLKPDVVIVNSCIWDISRYRSSWTEDYKDNLHKFFNELRMILPEESLIIWNLTMPLGESIRGGFLVPEIEHKVPQLRFDVIEANFFSGTLADVYDMDVLDLHYQFRFSLQHRTKDGIHWNAIAHRRITSLLMQHIAQAWGVILHYPLTADAVNSTCHGDDFSSDSLPIGYLSFDNPEPQPHCHENAENFRPAVQPLPHRPPCRRPYEQNPSRNGFGNQPTHYFEHREEYPRHHDDHFVMRNRHSRRHYAPYTHHRPAHHGFY
ncbi:protein fantom [Nematolebias whitei]|uniref:protein fantom n=1 Tax=Nematolebias whitei TaxID=451745 RepID=UPI00189BF25B|nr:protein fantom [Nematolebias whitei]